MTVKMIALDLDGTLLRNDKSIDPSSAEVLRRAQEQGIIITLASGRDKNGCRFVYEPLKLEEGNNYLALVNGQMIYSFARKEYELDDVLDNTDAQKIMKTVKDYDVEAIFCCGYDFYDYISRRRKVCKKLSQLVNGRSGDYGLASGKEHRNFIAIKDKNDFTQDINKVILVHTKRYFRRHLHEIRAQLSDYDLLEVGPEWIEIMPRNVNKASALRHIAEENGFTMDEVMAFGDAENDIEMLRSCRYGIAMGNAMAAVKEAAFAITSSNEEQGIARAIRRYVFQADHA